MPGRYRYNSTDIADPIRLEKILMELFQSDETYYGDLKKQFEALRRDVEKFMANNPSRRGNGGGQPAGGSGGGGDGTTAPSPDPEDDGTGGGGSPGGVIKTSAPLTMSSSAVNVKAPKAVAGKGKVTGKPKGALNTEKYTTKIPLFVEGAEGELGSPQFGKLWVRDNSTDIKPPYDDGEMRVIRSQQFVSAGLNPPEWYNAKTKEWVQFSANPVIRSLTTAERHAITDGVYQLILDTDLEIPVIVFYDNIGLQQFNYFMDIHRCTLANLPTVFSVDEGLIVHVTDYDHILRVDSTGNWEWGPGNSGIPGNITFFTSDPNTATASNSWQLCDGTTSVSIMQSDGTTTNVNTPNMITGGRFGFGVTLVGDGTYSNVPVNGITDQASMTTDVQSGSGTTVAGAFHTHNVSTPDHIAALPYMRR